MISPDAAYFYSVRMYIGAVILLIHTFIGEGRTPIDWDRNLFMKKIKNRIAQHNDRPYHSRIPERVEQVLELPVGSLSGAARIELSGNRRAVVEGCRGIVEYSDGLIRLNTSSGIVRFTGNNLSMSCLTEENAVVEGVILAVEFLS